MSVAKCMFLPIILAVIGVMWFLYRKKTNQVLVLIAIGTLASAAYRFSQVPDDDPTFQTAAIVVGALALLGLVVWVINMIVLRKKPRRRRPSQQ